MTFQLHTLGSLRLDPADRVTGAAAQRRRLALLALLAAHERGLTREKAVGYLWAELPAARARHLLSESLYVLRRALGEDAIHAVKDELRLNTDVVWTDLTTLRAGIASDRTESVADLYGGPFLDGFYVSDAEGFEQWLELERERVAREYGRALQAVAERAAAAGDRLKSADWWARAAAHEPFSSRIALRYMEALANAGDRARALQHGVQHAERLRNEIGVEPDAELTAFAARLQKTEPAPAPVTPTSARIGDLRSDEFAPDFELLREIGRGTVGAVYLAREPALKRLVAIKVLLPDLAAEESVRLRFEREAQAAARIQHPNVATAFRFGRTRSGLPWFVMPYIAGGSLEDRLAASGPLPMPEARKVIAQIASALAAAHRLGLVHRDVRPANILYDREADRVLLTDFGLAAVLESGDETGLRLTRPGEQLGSAAYASPEQLRGETVTERADVYSLGVVAFELLTGRLPFDPSQSVFAARTAEPLRLRSVLPDADEKLEALIGRCLNQRPEQRPYANELAGNS